MSAENIIEKYMSQTGNAYASAEHYAHQNGSTHTNNSGHHADTGQTGGGGHGDYYDTSVDY